ncbi:elongation factor P [Treponema sp.]|uniref:elongation factor P n=1 Tax=Treponema sp. TaxID=166 RepID=UPI0025D8F7B2|nr:elongation factor P [Treponema sp.]MCR5218644.1 elongation factor P [Treponema sp.]
MITTNEIRVGSAFMFEGSPFIVQRMLGQKSGRAGITVKLRVKNIVTGGTQDLGLDAGEKFDEVDLDEKKVKLSYIDGEDYHFMDQETYDDISITKEDLGDNAGYVSPDDDYEVSITFYEGKAVGVNPPIKVTRTITYCEPGIKGDTSGKSLKPATLDTGIEVKVPLFCNTDDRIVIDTRDGSFVERAKD